MKRTIEDIRLDLVRLTQEAQSINNNLVTRLQEIQKWIYNKKPGLIQSKKYLIQFLEELVFFTNTWIKIQKLNLFEKKIVLDSLTESEKYWYEYLFLQWINEKDPKIRIWKQKLLDGSFVASDKQHIKNIRDEIVRQGGNTFSSYIADLSMATDIIVTKNKKLPFCIQITTLRIETTSSKQGEWLNTLTYWKIERGLFISFNPSLNNINFKIAESCLEHSDLSQNICYCVINLDRYS